MSTKTVEGILSDVGYVAHGVGDQWIETLATLSLIKLKVRALLFGWLGREE